ncbi:MAG: flagellar export chaperone FliS [Sphingorhabdus sp.]|uniref:flagellar export chaperone FliS n=1 Tax=Sphingorhabdus sp. TaxID=1902408 RepID=UPI003C9BFD96
MLDPHYCKASAHYRALALSSQTESADPHTLVAMLYDELLLCIDVLTLRASRDRPLTDDEQAHRTRGIIIALRAGLDFESGGELALTLDNLYDALSSEFEERLAEPDPQRFAELRAGILSLTSAWKAIADT